jgi:Family of unknown function (DUF6338)
VPDSLEAVLALLVAVAPGVLFMTLGRFWVPQAKTSPLRDLGLVVLVSAVATSAGLLVVRYVAAVLLDWDDDVDALEGFLAGDVDIDALGIDRLVIALAAVLAASCAIAALLAYIPKAVRGPDPTIADPWDAVFKPTEGDAVMYGEVEMPDGTRWRGRLGQYSTADDAAARSIVLQRPVQSRSWTGGEYAHEVLIDEVAFTGDQIVRVASVAIPSTVHAQLLEASRQG